MCGLVGLLRLDGGPIDRDLLGRMTAMLAHRGPDGEGVYISGSLGLGHRRLAMLDLTAASAQPMASPDGRHVLVYNGELYNFRALRAELEALGHRFASTGDTEVVLQALRQWGARAVERFNGMFALAFWDCDHRTLLLARDRYGIKPLYWTRRGDSLMFASEIKAFLPHPDFRAEMNVEALAEYMTFQNFFSEDLLFKGVKILPAGARVVMHPDRRHDPVPDPYWDFDFQEPEAPLSQADYIEQFDGLLRNAVSRQLVADSPVGVYLSGGMDTGSIAALASRESSGVRSFTIGFDLRSASGIELNFDEREAAENMSYLFGTEHYEMVLKAGDMERVLPKLVWHLEEPRVGQSYPNYFAAHLAGKFGRAVLSGTGGDELFGGYPWRYYRAMINDDFEQYLEKYFSYWQRLLPDQMLPKVMAPSWPSMTTEYSRERFRNVFRQHASRLTRPADYVNHSLYFEAKTFLHGLLVVEDKLSMAHGLEVRLPFLDNDLVNFAMSLPLSCKLGRIDDVLRMNENEPRQKRDLYFEKTNDGKLLLRQAMRKYVPQSVVSAAKQGFSGPDASWFKGESMNLVRRLLMEGDAMIYDYLDPKPLRALIAEHLSGQANRRLLIWSLLNLEYWCQIFLKGKPPC